MVKSLSAMWKTWVLSLGQEDPLEKEMATHSSILAWKIPLMEELGELQSMGLQRVRHNLATKPNSFSLSHPLLPFTVSISLFSVSKSLFLPCK